MDNFLPLNELVSSLQPSLNKPSCLRTVTSMNSSLQQNSATAFQTLSLEHSKNVAESNKSVSSSQQSLMTTLSDQQPSNSEGVLNYNADNFRHLPPIQYLTSVDSSSANIKSISTDQLNSANVSSSNDGNTLSSLPENQPSVLYVEPSESDSDDFVLKLHHFDEILEFCSNVYVPCKCDVCGTSYNTFEKLLENCGNHEVYTCSVCDKSFQRKDLLQKHKQKHSNYGLIKKSFTIPLNPPIKRPLSSEGTVASLKKLFTCDTCGKFFKTQVYLNKHIKICVTACHLCGKVYKHKTSLDNHLNFNHSGKRYLCEICGKSLISPINLRLHMQCHKDEKNFKCDICNRAFSRKKMLKSHRLLHSEDRPYLCHLCPKSFRSSSYLSEHIKTHSDERPFKCSECGSGFITKSKLRRHEYIHSENKPHYCLTCGKGFSQKALLVRHFKIHPQQI